MAVSPKKNDPATSSNKLRLAEEYDWEVRFMNDASMGGSKRQSPGNAEVWEGITTRQALTALQNFPMDRENPLCEKCNSKVFKLNQK